MIKINKYYQQNIIYYFQMMVIMIMCCYCSFRVMLSSSSSSSFVVGIALQNFYLLSFFPPVISSRVFPLSPLSHDLLSLSFHLFLFCSSIRASRRRKNSIIGSDWSDFNAPEGLLAYQEE